METLLLRVGPAGRLAWDSADAAPADLVPMDNARLPDTVVPVSWRQARRSPLRDPTLATLAAEDIFGHAVSAPGARGKA